MGTVILQAGDHALDAQSASRMASALRHARRPYVVRLLAWFILLNASMLAIRFLPQTQGMWRNTAGHALLELCGALIAGIVSYCLWVQYRVSTKRQMLLATIAFSGIMSGHLVHGVTLAFTSGAWHFASVLGHQFFTGWMFVGALLLIAVARESTMDNSANCRRFGLRMIWGTQAASMSIAGMVLLFSRGHVATHLHLTPTAASVFHMIGRLASSTVLSHVLAMATMLVALVAFTVRYLQDEDAFSDGIVQCLVLAISAAMAELLSRGSYDTAWWISHLMSVSALLVLLFELGREFGASYSDAQNRINHLEAVYHVSSQLGTTLDLRVVLLVLVSDIADMLQARFSSVMLADDTGETLRTVATHGLPESPLKRNDPQKVEGFGRPGFYSGHTARAFREKRICTVDDVFTDVEFVPWKTLAKCSGYAV